MGAHELSLAILRFVLWGFLILFFSKYLHLSEASCRDRVSSNCCSGWDNECVSYTRNKTVCFCNNGCQKHQDCCEDYRQVCQMSAIDGEVGPWSPWSSCTSSCGVGTKGRSRPISVHPRNGGTLCPKLRQQRECFRNNAICNTAKDMAKILPDFFKKSMELWKEKKDSYCVYLRVKRASPACKLEPWSAQMVKKRLVCAECQRDAMLKMDHCAGHGQEKTK